MASRLDELQRQRALLEEHLAWLDREIAAEKSGTTPVAASLPPAPGAGPSPERRLRAAAPVTAVTTATAADATVATTINVVSPGAVGATGGAPAAPDAILDQYRQAPDMLQNDIRKGCFLYFALAFVLLGIGVGALYVLFQQ